MIKNNKWICTDPDNKQYGRQLSETEFEFKERGEEMFINLDNYNEDEIDNHISAYYNSINELKNIYKEQSNWIIAECIFEQESGLY